MALKSIGVSSFGNLKGSEQFMEESAARQLNKVNRLFEDHFGYGFSPNEGVRSQERQTQLWNDWVAYRNGGAWAPLAAFPFSSTHDPSRGSAVDIGVTGADGNSRALTLSEHDWLETNGPQYGLIWTGGDPSFMTPSEWWHFNVYPERASIIVTPADEIRDLEEGNELTPEEKNQLKNVSDKVDKILQAMGREEKRSAKVEKALIGPKSDLAKIKNSVGALVKKVIG